jgi:hypothetical protein
VREVDDSDGARAMAATDRMTIGVGQCERSLQSEKIITRHNATHGEMRAKHGASMISSP